MSVELKALWMRVQWYRCDLSMRGSIDNSQCAVAVADKHLTGLRVDTHVVRIAAELDLPDRREVAIVEQPYRTVACICDVERISRRIVAHALRLRQTIDETVEPL